MVPYGSQKVSLFGFPTTIAPRISSVTTIALPVTNIAIADSRQSAFVYTEIRIFVHELNFLREGVHIRFDVVPNVKTTKLFYSLTQIEGVFLVMSTNNSIS